MKMDGKVLFYNESDGRGIIITPQKEKIEFSVQEWNDFDIMPCTGLLVTFYFEAGTATDITSKSSEPTTDPSFPDISPNAKAPSTDDNESSEKNLQSDLPTKKLDTPPKPPSASEKELVSDTSESSGECDDAYVIAQESMNLFDGLEESVPEREESITVTLNLPIAVAHYFNIIENHIKQRVGYKKVSGRLDYLLARRFVWTTYHNLSEIDLSIITPKIKILASDLKVMSRVYDDFSSKTRHQNLAFEEVFLSCQAEYTKIKEGAEKIIKKLNLLRTNEKVINDILVVTKEDLNKNIKSVEFDAMQKELKSLSGTYVDVVHMIAELDERYKHDLKLLNDFEHEYREEFYKIFSLEAKKYQKNILEILNAQAYILDEQLWQKAKESPSIIAYFKKSSVVGEFNTKTYLKYYLNSLDSTKAGTDNKALFVLYEYLVSLEKNYILVVANSAQDAMDYESYIKHADKKCNVKSFIDEKAAIKWAMKNSVKVLIVEDKLQSTKVEIFWSVYHNHVFEKPKIILIGNQPLERSSAYCITKFLMKNTSSRVIADTIKLLLAPNS